MTVPYHTHNFELPVATKEDIAAGVSQEKVVVPSSLGSAAIADVHQFATAKQGEMAATAVQPDRKIVLGSGLFGGGDLSHDIEISLASSVEYTLKKADSAVQPDRKILTGDGLVGGGDLGKDLILSLDETTRQALLKAQSAVQPDRKITLGWGLVGGGTLEKDPFIDFGEDTRASLRKADSSVQLSRKIFTEKGLQGGGDLSKDLTLSLDDTSYQKLQGAVQKSDLKALAYKDAINIEDISATGERDKDHFLAASGEWLPMALSKEALEKMKEGVVLKDLPAACFTFSSYCSSLCVDSEEGTLVTFSIKDPDKHYYKSISCQEISLDIRTAKGGCAHNIAICSVLPFVKNHQEGYTSFETFFYALAGNEYHLKLRYRDNILENIAPLKIHAYTKRRPIYNADNSDSFIIIDSPHPAIINDGKDLLAVRFYGRDHQEAYNIPFLPGDVTFPCFHQDTGTLEPEIEIINYRDNILGCATFSVRSKKSGSYKIVPHYKGKKIDENLFVAFEVLEGKTPSLFKANKAELLADGKDKLVLDLMLKGYDQPAESLLEKLSFCVKSKASGGPCPFNCSMSAIKLVDKNSYHFRAEFSTTLNADFIVYPCLEGKPLGTLQWLVHAHYPAKATDFTFQGKILQPKAYYQPGKTFDVAFKIVDKNTKEKIPYLNGRLRLKITDMAGEDVSYRCGVSATLPDFYDKNGYSALVDICYEGVYKIYLLFDGEPVCSPLMVPIRKTVENA